MKLIKKVGIWELYKNEKGYHIEGHDKRNNMTYVYPHAHVIVNGVYFSETYGMEIIVSENGSKGLSKKARHAFLNIMR